MLWPKIVKTPKETDTCMLSQLAADLDTVTTGYGWYWVGRALFAVSMGEPKDNLLAAVRQTLRRWRETDSWGSDAPASGKRRPQAAPQAAPGPKVSDREILTAKDLSNRDREIWMRRFRNAEPADRPDVLGRFRQFLESQEKEA
jgi:hypothetical protein